MWPFTRRSDFDAMEERDNGFTAFRDLLAGPAAAGMPVNETTAVNLPAVYKCISLNAETIASLPIDVYVKREGERVKKSSPGWLVQPNPMQDFADFVAMTQVSLDLNGNAYWIKVSAGGLLVGLELAAPAAVQPELHGGQPIYWIQKQDGSRDAYAHTEIVHLRGLTMPGQLLGLSPIGCARQTIGIGLAAEQYGANFFGNGATLSGVIESPGSLTVEQAERLKEAFTKRHGGITRSHAIGILSGGAAWKPMSVNPDEAQFLATRNYTNSEIAQMFGYPPSFFDTDGAKGYVTALHATMRLWHILGLNPRLTRIERALTGLLPRGTYARFNRGALLQMEPSERVAYYAAAQQGEWMNRNEIRALEDMNPIPDGDEFLHSVQWQENAPPDGGGTDDSPEPAPAGSPVKEPAQ